MNVTTRTIAMTADGDNIVDFTPSERRNICTFFNKSGEYQFVVDTSRLQFGDELVMLFSKNEADLILNFPSEQFVLTYCGSSIQQLTLTGIGGNTGGEGFVASDTWETQFFFDGEKFIYTMDLG